LTPAGFFVFIILVLSIAVVVLSRVKRCNEGILSEARFDKTTQRNPRQRRAQCESNFRRHAHDETGFVSAVQAFNYKFVMQQGHGNAIA
jgi:hypothetical protein